MMKKTKKGDHPTVQVVVAVQVRVASLFILFWYSVPNHNCIITIIAMLDNRRVLIFHSQILHSTPKTQR